MALFHIERVFSRLHKGCVAEYRRIVTPFFFVKLKSRTYTYFESKSPFLYLPLPWPALGTYMKLPDGKLHTYKGWDDEQGDKVTDQAVSDRLNLENERSADNVLRMSHASR